MWQAFKLFRSICCCYCCLRETFVKHFRCFRILPNRGGTAAAATAEAEERNLHRRSSSSSPSSTVSKPQNAKHEWHTPLPPDSANSGGEEGAKVLPKSLNRKQVLACALRPAGLPACLPAFPFSEQYPALLIRQAEISQKLQWKHWEYPLESQNIGGFARLRLMDQDNDGSGVSAFWKINYIEI